MYKNLNQLFFFGLLSIVLFACQKEINNRLPIILSSKNPTALSAEIRVWHGTRTKAALPVPHGNGLQLDPAAQPKVNAFAGRYAIIKPEVLSGDVKGYYIAVNGANDFFTVDYTKPRHINGRIRDRRPQRQDGLGALRMDSISGGNADSALVIALPANIQVPDTICMTYWAYDSLGNISQPVSTCIIVSSLGTDPASAWIYGTWKNTASWSSAGDRDTTIFNQWIKSNGYACFTDSATGQTYLGSSLIGSVPIAFDSIHSKKNHFGLSQTGAFQYDFEQMWKTIDVSASTCSSFSYRPTDNISDMITGGWNYNRSSGKFQMVMEVDDMGQVVIEAWEYKLQRISDTHFILIDDEDPLDIYYIRFQK